MLDKEVCIKCCNKNRYKGFEFISYVDKNQKVIDGEHTYYGNPWNEDDERNWKNKEVNCAFFEDEYQMINLDEIPFGCYYKLEQIIKGN
jgi:hypothetical protein